MSVQVTKHTASRASLDYYLHATIEEGSSTAYYTAPGNPLGRWMGSGTSQLGLQAGTTAHKTHVQRLFGELAHPTSNTPLIAGYSVAERAQRGKSTVGFWDMTFTVPKSVSVLAAMSDDTIRDTIMRCHDKAIEQTLEYFEQNVAQTRTGKAGVNREKTMGVMAVGFRHYDSRAHDPHLHTHVLVSNVVRRADGAWGTLDGASLLGWSVTLSEMHSSILRDMLSKELGVSWQQVRAVGAGINQSYVYELAGMDDNVRRMFSTRAASVAQTYQRLQQEQEHKLGRPLTNEEIISIKRQAYEANRPAKDHSSRTYDEMCSDWQRQAIRAGYKPGSIVQSILDARQHETYVADQTELTAQLELILKEQLADNLIYKIITRGHEASGLEDTRFSSVIRMLRYQVGQRATTISEANVRAELYRLTASIPFESQAVQQQLIDRLTEQVLESCVPLSPQRYQVDSQFFDDPRLGVHRGIAGVDEGLTRQFVIPELAQAETFLVKIINHMPETGTQQTIGNIDALITEYNTTQEHPLSPDQAKAVKHMLASRSLIDGMIGPAGSGKTTTMRAFIDIWEQRQQGSVVGVAPSARAAGELASSLGITTHTVDKLLDEQISGREHARLANITEQLEHCTDITKRRQLRRQLASQQALVDSLELPAGGVLVVDEASMVSSMHMAALTSAARHSNTRILAVGDPAQLDAVGAGEGWFARLHREHPLPELSTIFRFQKQGADGTLVTDEHMAQLSLKIRDCTPKQARELAQQLVDEGIVVPVVATEELETQAIERLEADLAQGNSHIISAGTNELVDKINSQVTRRRQDAGLADSVNRIILADGLNAGAGDIIATRDNARSMKDSDGVEVHNNDQWMIERIQGNNVHARRMDESNATISFPTAWLASHAQLGYAITVHRSQGATVTRATTVEPVDTMSERSGLYVALTRGRLNNTLYMQVADPESVVGYDLERWRATKKAEAERAGRTISNQELNPTAKDLAVEQVAAILERSHKGRMASERAFAARLAAYDPVRIRNEYDRFSTMLAAPVLTEQLKQQLQEHELQEIRQSSYYASLEQAWAKVRALDEKSAQQTLEKALHPEMGHMREKDGQLFEMQSVEPDVAKRAFYALRETQARLQADRAPRALDLPPVLEADRARDPAIASMVDQAAGLLEERSLDAGKAAMAGHYEWAKSIMKPDPDNEQQVKDYGRLITDIGVYRRQHHISSMEQPLGDTSDHSEYVQLSRVLDQWMQERQVEREAVWQAPEPEVVEPEAQFEHPTYTPSTPTPTAGAGMGAGAA